MKCSIGLIQGIATAVILASASSALATEARYNCDSGTTLVARFSPPNAQNGSARLIFGDGREVALPQVQSADGGRYAGDGIEFWIKGRNATLTRRNKSETCSTP